MNSYQLKQTIRSRRNNAQKVQRPLLNFKASKDKAKDRRKSSSNDQNQEDIYRGDDAGDNEVISDHASGDDNDDMDDISSDSQGSNRSSFDYRSDESDDEHCSFESKLKLIDVNWPVRIGKNNSCFSNMDTFKEPELPFLKFHICPLFCTAFV